MPSIQVRAARRDEFDVWTSLWRGCQAFYQVHITDEVSPLTWHRYFDVADPTHCDLIEVDGVVRAQGLGRRLIEHVYAQAKVRGCARVHWLTHETHVDAMKLYDRIADKPGFVQCRKAI